MTAQQPPASVLPLAECLFRSRACPLPFQVPLPFVCIPQQSPAAAPMGCSRRSSMLQVFCDHCVCARAGKPRALRGAPIGTSAALCRPVGGCPSCSELAGAAAPCHRIRGGFSGPLAAWQRAGHTLPGRGPAVAGARGQHRRRGAGGAPGPCAAARNWQRPRREPAAGADQGLGRSPWGGPCPQSVSLEDLLQGGVDVRVLEPGGAGVAGV